MKRKVISLLLVLSGIICLGGCALPMMGRGQDTQAMENSAGEILGGTEKSDAEDGEKGNSKIEDGNTEQGKTEAGTIADGTQYAGTLARAPVIAVTTDTREWYTQEEGILLLQVGESLVEVENKGFQALEDALKQRFTAIEEEDYTLLVESAKEDYNSREGDWKTDFNSYYSYQTAELSRSDSKVVSLRMTYSEYSGGVHGMYAYGGATFAVESGAELELADILTDADGFRKAAVDYISDALYEEYGDVLWPEYKECIRTTFAEGGNLNWYLDGTGIVFTYSPYELGPYAMGAPEVTLPYEKFAQYLDKKYTVPSGELFARITENENAAGLLGEEGEILVKTEADESDMLRVSVLSKTAESEVGQFGWFCDAYAVKRADGRSFLLVVCDYMSDDKVTFVYEVTGGKATKCDELNRARIEGGYLTSEEIELTISMDVLGTYSSKMKYKMNQNGKLSQTEEVFHIDNRYNLVVVKELPVVLEGAENLLQPGITIRITGTNNIDEAYFVIPDTGQTGVIIYGFEDADNPWIHTIDGVSEYDYFENIPYAG